MRDFSVPEILRVPLDSLSLQVKAANEEEDVSVRISARHSCAYGGKALMKHFVGVPWESH